MLKKNLTEEKAVKIALSELNKNETAKELFPRPNWTSATLKNNTWEVNIRSQHGKDRYMVVKINAENGEITDSKIIHIPH